MSKFAARVQDKRKARARRADLAHDQLMTIYSRATQGGSEAYLTINQPSDPARVIAKAEERRQRRGLKERALRPRQGFPAQPTAKPTQYQTLSSGQVVGYPRPMREVKQEARQSRLVRRDDFRMEKRAA